MNTVFQDKMLGVFSKADFVLRDLGSLSIWKTLVDLAIVSAIIYFALVLIKETRAQRMIYGLLLIVLLLFIGRVLNLTVLNWVLKNLITTILIAVPVIFQPELRAGLERLGRTGFVGRFGALKHPELIQTIEDIVLSSELLSKQKIGALIVIERTENLKNLAANGRALDALLSFELLLSIFQPKNPLHDGAVIVSGNRLLAASVTLPVFQGSLEYNLGTRHKAALATAQQCDALVIVVSEEKGTISLTHDGKLKFDITPEELKRALLRLLKQENQE